MIYVIVIIAICCILWFALRQQFSSPAVEIKPTGISIKQTNPYQNDYIKLEVVYSGKYVRFDIAGLKYRSGISRCLGEFDGALVAEPDNPHDPQAVKIIHPNGTHVGYVPRNVNGDSVRIPSRLPRPCHCIILEGERGYYGICVVPE